MSDSSISVTYKGAEIANITESGTTTLKTAGTYCEDDIGLVAQLSGGGADISLGITGATVDQIAKITAVDSNGKPTAWESVDMPEGGNVTDDQVSDAVSSWLTEHPEATTTVQDGSITEEKLSSELLNSVKSIGYVQDSDGNRYSVEITDGVVSATRIYELMGQEDVVKDYEVVDGILTDIVSGTQFTGINIDDNSYISAPNKNPETLDLSLFPDNIATIELVFNANADMTGDIIKSNYYNYARLAYGYNDFSADSESLGGIYSCLSSQFCLSLRAPFSIKSQVNELVQPMKNGDDYYLCLLIDGVNGNSKVCINDKSYEVYNSNPDYFSGKGLARIDRFQFGYQPLKFVKFYNRHLTDAEIDNNYKSYLQVKEDADIDGVIINGIEGLGSAAAYNTKGDGFEYLDTNIKVGNYVYSNINHNWAYSIVDYTHPTREVDNSAYTSVTIINKRTDAIIGRKFSMTAYPFPVTYDGSAFSHFDIEWESSDETIATVINGVIVPTAEGEVTITARLVGTEIEDSVTITVSAEEEIVYVNYDVPNHFEQTPINNWKYICDAIYFASTAGYNKVTFPKGVDIWIYPPDECYLIPSNITVDFNGCNVRVVDSAKSQNGYSFFKFEDVENSKVVNGVFYGERYNTQNSESYYSEQIKFLVFGNNAKNCWLENFNFYSPCGFNIATEAGWNFWSGLPSYKNGQIYYTDFSFGKIGDDGTIVKATDWIVTDFKEFSTDETFKRFRFSCSDGMGLGFTQRLNDVAFYDSAYNLLAVMRNVYRYQEYDVPEGTAYWKFSIYASELPTKNNNYADDNCILRMAKGTASIDCGVRKCMFFNTASGAFSGCGASENFHFEKCYVSGNGKKNAWAFDLEDGWQTMRHTIVDNCKMFGNAILSGHGNVVISSALQTLNMRDDCELSTIVNNAFQYQGIATIRDKFEALFAHNYYNKLTTGGSGTVTESENVQKKMYV